MYLATKAVNARRKTRMSWTHAVSQHFVCLANAKKISKRLHAIRGNVCRVTSLAMYKIFI